MLLSDSELDNHNKSYLYLDENWNEFADLIARLSTLDEDESSPIHKLNNHIASGASIVLKNDILKACAHAKSLLAENNDYLFEDEIAYIRDTLNKSINAVTNRGTRFNTTSNVI